MSLQTEGMLVYFSAGCWAGRKLDERATKQVQKEFNAGRKTGNYTKYLVSQDAIKEYSKIIQDFRNWLNSFCKPWDNTKGMLLAVSRFQEFDKKFQETREAFWDSVNKFCENYPDLIAVAMQAGELGDLFNSNDYPPAWKIKDKFYFEVQYFPIVDINDFRISVQAADLERIKAETAATYEKQLAQNTADLYNQAKTTVKHLLDKLLEPETRENGRKSSMKESTLEKVQALSSFIQDYNFQGDKNLDSIAGMLKALDSFNIDGIRGDAETKQEITAKTKEIFDKINQYC